MSAEFSPDRFMIAYTVAGTILASRRPTNPVGWAPEHLSLWVREPGPVG